MDVSGHALFPPTPLSRQEDTELTPAYISDCPAILAALEEIRVLFSSTNLYVVNIQEIARTDIWIYGTI
ncbi:hypothetical protein TNCV_1322751 [Trichonephila clavipes]|nr:hypothetical protein TNCV_1322751 [Trichonephila clavipes]